MMKGDFRAAHRKPINRAVPKSGAGTNSTARKKARSISPVTLRLTADERAKLEELAEGMTLSAYIRACVFGKEERRRKRRPRNIVADKKAVSQALALLGQSRIANNLNQLAYQANIGALVMEERERAQIEEAYNHVRELRFLLIKTLEV